MGVAERPFVEVSKLEEQAVCLGPQRLDGPEECVAVLVAVQQGFLMRDDLRDLQAEAEV